MRAQELQVANIEKQQILEFESQLAAASSKQLITEQSSLLLSTIIGLNPHEPLRRPRSSHWSALELLRFSLVNITIVQVLGPEQSLSQSVRQSVFLVHICLDLSFFTFLTL